jgi:hypothetical protein
LFIDVPGDILTAYLTSNRSHLRRVAAACFQS